MQVLYLGSDYLDESRITVGVPRGTMVETVFLGFLIRADEGNILVDTGFHPDDAAEENAAGLQVNVQPEDLLPERLKEVGLSMDDINMLVVTHLDLDHIGWLSHLRNAEVVAQKEEYRFSLDPPPYARLRRSHPQRYNSPDIKWKLIDGDELLLPGLAVMLTPGHTPGSQSLLVNLPKSGPILLVGDVGHFQKDFEQEIVPTGTDPKQALYSIKRLKTLSQILKAPILATHDKDYWEKEMIKAPEAYT